MCSSLSTIPSRGGKVQHFGSFDYVIAGAGSAGCLLANRLSRDPDTRVLLLEAGGSDDWFWIDVPEPVVAPASLEQQHAGATTGSGSTSRSATSTPSPIRAPTGATGPSPTPIWPAARSITRAAGCWAAAPRSTP